MIVAYSKPPPDLKSGARTTFTLTQVKQYGPSSLRGRANDEQLDAAIGLLIKLGFIAKEGSHYQFSETLVLKRTEPQMKNGELLTIKELALFSELIPWKSDRPRGLTDQSGYFFKASW